MGGPVQGAGQGGVPNTGPVSQPVSTKVIADGGTSIAYGNPVAFTPTAEQLANHSITEHMVPGLQNAGAPNGAPVDVAACSAEATTELQESLESGVRPPDLPAEQANTYGQLQNLQNAVQTTVHSLTGRHPNLSGRIYLTATVSGGTAPNVAAGNPGTPGGVTSITVSTIDQNGNESSITLPEGLTQEQLFDEIAGASAYVQTTAIPEGEEVMIAFPLSL